MRGLVIGIGCAAIVATGLTGCSSGSKSEEKATEKTTASVSSPSATTSSPSATASAGSVTASAGAGTATVIIDGQPQDIEGEIVCTAINENLSIAIGEQATGIAVMIAPDASNVTSVGLGNVNGVTLGYQAGAPGGSATATKSDQTYTISGTATGVDMANPMQPTTKPFEITVTCP